MYSHCPKNFLDEMGHLHVLLDQMGLDKMALNLSGVGLCDVQHLHKKTQTHKRKQYMLVTSIIYVGTILCTTCLWLA